ncbi:MAG TPA: hypothetical protein PKL60_05200 [Anaerolineaceae bacterium]|nr:hypothetical protein [Anaerolineaceae bacterium]
MSEQIVQRNEQVIKTEVKELVQVVNDDFRAPYLIQDFFANFPGALTRGQSPPYGKMDASKQPGAMKLLRERTKKPEDL